MPTKIAVIYYSSTGNVHQLAQALAEGAEEAGAEVRLRRVAELAPEDAIQANPDWAQHRDAVAGEVPEASVEDLEWAHGFAFGTPTRFGNPTSQLKQFIDQTGGLWAQGKLADKAATTFTSAMNAHGGIESTILAINNVFYHWGSVIVAPGYTDQRLFEAGGNPYGASWASGGSDDGRVGDAALEAARIQGRRLATIAGRLSGEGVEETVPADQQEAYAGS